MQRKICQPLIFSAHGFVALEFQNCHSLRLLSNFSRPQNLVRNANFVSQWVKCHDFNARRMCLWYFVKVLQVIVGMSELNPIHSCFALCFPLPVLHFPVLYRAWRQVPLFLKVIWTSFDRLNSSKHRVSHPHLILDYFIR